MKHTQLLPQLAWALAVVLKLCTSTSTRSKNAPEATTTSGKLRGFHRTVLGKDLSLFFNVPFAKPPIGSLRFQPPEPVEPWKGTRDSVTLSSACYQERDETFPGFSGAEMWNANTPLDEDCLYMNIWAPSGGRNLPVLVWFFGGGFWYGSPSLDVYNADGLAAQGHVIIINVNYRIGAFGFLYMNHELIPGNMGLLDQQMAVQWIKANIQHFGGNPDKITLFGESAGAASVVAHMIAPNSRGLFHNGILQSGSIQNPWAMDPPERALYKSREFIKGTGCLFPNIAETLCCLQERPAVNISKSIWTSQSKLNFMEFPLVPVSLDYAGFFKKDAFQALREKDFVTTDLIVGVNGDEGSFWIVYYLPDHFTLHRDENNRAMQNPEPKLSKADYVGSVTQALNRENLVVQRAAAFTYDWGNNGGNCNNQTLSTIGGAYANAVNQMVGDYQFTCDSMWLADVLSGLGARVYVYLWEHLSSSNPWPRWMGAIHASEIDFVFGIPLTMPNRSIDERILSKDIVGYWSSFARNGVPEGKERYVQWPRYYTSTKEYFVLKTGKKEIRTFLKQKECELWDSVRLAHYNNYKRNITSGGSSAFIMLSSSRALCASLLLLSLHTSKMLFLRQQKIPRTSI